MRTLLLIPLAACAVAVPAAPVAAQADGEDPFGAAFGAPKVRPASARLVADVSSVRPGDTFTLGLLIEIRPEWHVYWRNPGEAGMATHVRFEAPDGWDVSEVRWPVPVTFTQSGGIVGYGYEDSVLLTARVKVPGNAETGSDVVLSADAAWLGCKVKCIPGEASPALALRIASKTTPADRSRFKEAEKLLPEAVDQSPLVASHAVEGELPADGPGTFVAKVRWKRRPPSELTWLPVPGDELLVDSIRQTTEARTTTVRFKVRPLPGGKTPDRMDSLLLIQTRTPKGRGRRSGVSLPIRLRPAGEKPKAGPAHGTSLEKDERK